MNSLRLLPSRPVFWSLLVLTGLATAPSANAQAVKSGIPPKESKEAKDKPADKKAKEVDLNSAPVEELMTLPGIGESYARKLVDARPIKDLAAVSELGIPARTVEGLKGLAVVKPLPAPVDVNADPIGQLETLPGIGPALAKEIVAARPIAGYEELGKIKGLGASKVEALRGRVKFSKAEPKAEKKAEAKAEKAEAKVEKKAEPKAETEKKAEAKVAKGEKFTGKKVNLNTASLEELDALPGIGKVYSQAIVDNRPYKKADDIMKIKGIKEVEYGKIKDMITVD